MTSAKKQLKVTAPVLDLSEGSQMLSEFTTEAFNYLITAENSIFKLETIPNDQESIDTIFKVFHTINGLANFLNLNDIYCLAAESAKMFDMVRKSKIKYNSSVVQAISQAVASLRKLLMLLNEQINNNGKLKSPYYDISPTIDLIHNIINKLNIAEQEDEESKNEFPKRFSEVNTDQYEELKSRVSQKGKKITVDKDILRNLINDLELAQNELSGIQNKFQERQHSLIQERDMALDLGDQARTTAKIRSDFLSSIAHEIRTLINAILGFSDVLLKSSLTKKQQEQTRTIISSGKLLLDIVNNILDFAKLERGKLKLENITFDLSAAIKDIINISQGKIQKKPVNLTFTISDKIPTSLTGDPTRLKQILINLIDNALKFTDKGSVSVIVKTEESLSDSVVLRFAVCDTGIGIPEDKKNIIFESFTQADVSITRNYGGTGLGLAICKSYVEAMGGRIWVESTPGKGSQFIFTTCFGIGESKEKKYSENKSKVADAAFTHDAYKQTKLLVADDSVSGQELAKAYCEIIGCDIECVATGSEAVEKLKNNSYDMCLMDLQMPEMDGIEATKIVRGDLNLKIPIVALTAAAEDEEKQLCLQAGMNDYLAKPFNADDLKEKINIYVMQQKVRDNALDVSGSFELSLIRRIKNLFFSKK